MFFQQFSSAPSLQKFISSFMYLNQTFEMETILSCVPRDQSALIFILNPEEEHFDSVLQEKGSNCFTTKEVYLFGQFSHAWQQKLKGKFKFLMVVLKPLGVYRLLKDSCLPVSNNCICLNTLYPEVEGLMEKLKEEKLILKKIEHIENLMSHIFFRSGEKLDEVERVLSRILLHKGFTNIQEIEREEGICIASVKTKFKKKLGLSPKAFAQVVKFRYMMNWFLNDPDSLKNNLISPFYERGQINLAKDINYVIDGCISNRIGTHNDSC